MASKKIKQMVVTILEQKHSRNDWYVDVDGQPFLDFLSSLTKDMKRLGVALTLVRNRDTVIEVASYADLLNAFKISSPEDGQSNRCIGHIIGKSLGLDIREDISAAVRRMAFAPETIPPADEFRKVCHNCGCGC